MSRKSSRIPYLLAGLGVAVVVLVAWVTRGHFEPVGPGREAPSFTVASLRGDSVSLSDYEGQVVLLNIWATWCAPCRVEMPSLERLYQELEGEPFEILAVSVDAARGGRDEYGNPGGNIQAFADSLGLTFRILHDPTGRIQDRYRTTGVPETFLIGKDGIIYKKVAGGTEWDAPAYRELIERLLEG